ncbi:hypothetical protein A7982_12734 [Minicystis rosea]|nr:hypothetical protein A7982_12734 [Minicystis rosea]
MTTKRFELERMQAAARTARVHATWNEHAPRVDGRGRFV